MIPEHAVLRARPGHADSFHHVYEPFPKVDHYLP